MSFLTVANSSNSEVQSQAGGFGERIKKIILESSLLFESFGNAKTVRNDNSSRFGKYIKLQYSEHNQLSSAFTETFLLEKSRLVSVGKGERNYHVFYQMIRGLQQSNPGLINELKVHNVDMFSILTEGGCTVVNSEADDVSDFQMLCQALETLGCSVEEIQQLWRVCASILHLGNMNCESTGDENYPCNVLPKSSAGMTIPEIACLLGVDAASLVKGITEQRIQAARRASVNTKILSASDSKNNIFALIKWLYKRMFDWIVRKVNYSHYSTGHSGQPEQPDAPGSSRFIGILDIFGFEILGVNSFEQLCINYTNERLQQQFNEHIFVLEQQEYAREGLDWKSISFRDNQHVIDLISKKPTGLLIILEEHGMMNRKPDDQALVNSFNQTHDKVQTAYQKSRFGNDRFIVKHFAGDVTYTVDGFLSKNNDSLQDGLAEVIYISENVFLTNMLVPEDGNCPVALKPGPGYVPLRTQQGTNDASDIPVLAVDNKRASKKMASAQTVSFSFRNQLDLLMSTLRDTHPHYIKCIKPNAAKAADVFTATLVMEQLRYSGVLEVVRIRREGFPTKIPFVDFYMQYSILAFGKGWEQPDPALDPGIARQYCTILLAENLQALSKGSSCYQMGTNFVFLGHDGGDRMLEAINLFFTRRAARIQARFRRNRAVQEYARTRLLLVKVATFVRMSVHRRRFLRVHRQVAGIQRLYRIILFKRCIADKNRRRVLQRRHSAAILLQSHQRRHRTQRRVEKMRRQYNKVQMFVSKHYRRKRMQRRYQLILRSVLLVQSLMRCSVQQLRFRLARQRIVQIQNLWRTRSSLLAYNQLRAKIVIVQTWIRCRLASRALGRCIASIAKIQGLVRKWINVCKFRRSRRRLIYLQSSWRRYSVLTRYKLTRRRISILQCWYRMRSQRSRYRVIRCSAVKLQTFFRTHLAVANYLRLLLAVVRIQCKVRMYLARSKYLQSLQGKEEHVCATRLQAVVRGWMTHLAYFRSYICLVKVQSFFRMFMVRIQYTRQRQACQYIQSSFRKYLHQANYRRQRAAVLMLQSFLRMMIASRNYEKMNYYILVLQTSVRKYLARQQYLVKLFCVTVLQARVRCFLETRRYELARYAITKVNAMARRFVAQRKYETLQFSVLLIQSHIRRFIHESRYFITKYSVELMQTWMRRYVAQCAYLRARSGAIQIQSRVRSHLARRDYELIQYAVLVIQTIFRKYRVQSIYQLQQVAVVVMQAFVRMSTARSHYLACRQSAIRIQCVARMNLAITTCQYQRWSILLIQTYTRRMMCRLTFILKKSAMIRLQAWIRMVQARYRYGTQILCAVLQLSLAIRRFLATRQMQRLRLATGRIYQCVHRYVVNRRLLGRMYKVHHASITGNLTALQTHLKRFPQDENLRLRDANHCTITHSAFFLANNNKPESTFRNPLTVQDLMVQDSQRNELLHWAVMWPRYENLTYLDQLVSSINTVVNYEAKDEDEGDEDNVIRAEEASPTRGPGGSSSPYKQDTDAISGLPILMSGWMNKKRNSAMLGFKKWNRRWCILTEETLTYYKTDAKDSRPCGFLPLEGCIIDRPSGKEAIITVVSPQQVFKKGMFGDKMVGPLVLSVESERDLQGWLHPLKAAAGVTPFRMAQSIQFVNYELKESWLRRVNRFGDTVLHALARASKYWISQTPAGSASSSYVETNSNELRIRANLDKVFAICSKLSKAGTVQDTTSESGESEILTSFRALGEFEGLKITSWLLSVTANSSLLNQLNSNNKTALQVAIASRNAALIVLLYRRAGGGGTHEVGIDSSNDLLSESEAEQVEYAVMAMNYHGDTERNDLGQYISPSLSAPYNKAKGYSFMQIFFKKFYDYSGDK
jgi:myosin heavy subunit